MENNQFTEQQLVFLYNEQKFLDFISDYFSSYNTSDVTLSGGMNKNDQEISWKIFIRILIANINTVLEAIEKVERNISFSYEEKKIKSSGGIKGRLLVDEYVKNKSMVRLPKEYPCVLKEKTFATPENEYVVYIVVDIASRLNELLAMLENIQAVKGNETELKLLKENLDYFISIPRRYPFSTVMTPNFKRESHSNFSGDKINLIRNRFAKGKIRNSFAYELVFKWYEKFIKKDFTWLDKDNIKMLIYDEQFCNKLFEIWCLYKIIETFKNNFNMKEIDSNGLMPGLSQYVTKLRTLDGDYIEIYYQIGSGLYWNEEHKQNWHYTKGVRSGELIGVPDISVKYIGETENLTLIDLKNRVRKGGDNSEEIYKVIGYFSNFKEYLNEKYNNKYKNQCVLIFRNDFKPFVEELESDTGERIMATSAGVCEDDLVCDNQFIDICRYILDMQGIVGTKSGTISNCNKSIAEQRVNLQDAVMAHDEGLENDIIYQIESSNHSIVSSMFATAELKEVLEKKKEDLRQNHFPHIWSAMNENVIETIAMADCLFSGLTECENADYAPVCLEYCRAIEIQLNELIFTPFKNIHNVFSLAGRNWNYQKLEVDRELTLGECIFMLRKCTATAYATSELYNFIKSKVKQYRNLFDYGVDCLEDINVDIRRKAAHTALMSYCELVESRQRIMGIGNMNLLYMLLDER